MNRLRGSSLIRAIYGLLRNLYTVNNPRTEIEVENEKQPWYHGSGRSRRSRSAVTAHIPPTVRLNIEKYWDNGKNGNYYYNIIGLYKGILRYIEVV